MPRSPARAALGCRSPRLTVLPLAGSASSRHAQDDRHAPTAQETFSELRGLHGVRSAGSDGRSAGRRGCSARRAGPGLQPMGGRQPTSLLLIGCAARGGGAGSRRATRASSEERRRWTAGPRTPGRGEGRDGFGSAGWIFPPAARDRCCRPRCARGVARSEVWSVPTLSTLILSSISQRRVLAVKPCMERVWEDCSLGPFQRASAPSRRVASGSGGSARTTLRCRLFS